MGNKKKKTFAGKVMPLPENEEDWRCYVVDENGERVPMIVTSEIIVLVPNDDVPDALPTQLKERKTVK